MKKKIFGYGSLLDEHSLKATAPEVEHMQPAYIKGLTRDFSVWDKEGYTVTNLDVAGIPFCALDVKAIPDKDARVNGVVFEVNEASLSKLLVREQEYELIETIAFDYETNGSLGLCHVFSANKNNGKYDLSSKAQRRYLDVCLQAAKGYGEEFYQEFLETTFINGKSLAQMPELIS